jgi:2-hydroxy-4-carboxymuconate semialdehyde hemiacetal dehydrogenase
VWAQEGPHHPELGIAMDMTVGMQTPSGAMCTLALSFNNDGPLGTFFRYICDNGTYIARYDDLVDGNEKPGRPVGRGGRRRRHRSCRTASSSLRSARAASRTRASRSALPAMRTLHELEQSL